MAEITVRLVAGDDEEKSFFLSREFSSDVARLSGVVSHAPPAAAPEPGKRGDPITLGAIIIAAVSGGGALTALVGPSAPIFPVTAGTKWKFRHETVARFGFPPRCSTTRKWRSCYGNLLQ